MKTISYLILAVLLAWLLMVTACNEDRNKDDEIPQKQEEMNEAEKQERDDGTAMHKDHEALQNNFAHQDIIILKNVYRLSPSAEKALKEVVNATFK